MEQKELDKIIKLHEKWFIGNPNGKRANLSDEDLSGTNLCNVNLIGVNLIYANLKGAFLNYANLRDSNLDYTNLGGANLSGTDLSNADFNNTNLSDANLSWANLKNAHLDYADLRGADLSGVNFSNANLNNVDLRNTILNWVNWHEVKGIDVYVAGLQSSRHNAQLTYIPSLDVATTGCWQNTWGATKKRVKDVYKVSNPKIYKKYQLAFQYIEAQMKADN